MDFRIPMPLVERQQEYGTAILLHDATDSSGQKAFLDGMGRKRLVRVEQLHIVMLRKELHLPVCLHGTHDVVLRRDMVDFVAGEAVALLGEAWEAMRIPAGEDEAFQLQLAGDGVRPGVPNGDAWQIVRDAMSVQEGLDPFFRVGECVEHAPQRTVDFMEVRC